MYKDPRFSISHQHSRLMKMLRTKRTSNKKQLCILYWACDMLYVLLSDKDDFFCFLFLFLILYIMKMMMEYNRPLVCRTMHIIPYQDLRAAALQFSSSRIDGLKYYCPNYPHSPINVRATEQEEEKRARVVFQSCYRY